MQVERMQQCISGERVSNVSLTYPPVRDSRGKLRVIPDQTTIPAWGGAQRSNPLEERAISYQLVGAGNGPPRRRRVAGLRGRPATLGLRHCPDSYGRQQWGILRNGRQPDAATPREG